MSILKKALIKTSGNRFVQNLLEKNILASQYLMGIGSGGGVLTSGEQAIFHLLKQKKNRPTAFLMLAQTKVSFSNSFLKMLQ